MDGKVGFFRSIQVKLIIITVLLVLIAIQIIGVYFVQKLESQLNYNFSSSLNDRLNLLAYNVEQELKNTSKKGPLSIELSLKGLLLDFASSDIGEVRVIDNMTKVVATSDPNNQNIVGKRTSDTLVKRTILSGHKAEKVFIDKETGQRIRVITAPVKVNGENVAIIYLVASMEGIYHQINQVNKIFMTAIIIAMSVTIIIGTFLARTITKPILDMRKQALELMEGNFTRKVRIYGNDEIGQLAMSINTLTTKLKEANELTEGERRKLSSVLKHMRDGVIATNKSGAVILVNETASKMLGISSKLIMNQNILDVLGLIEEYKLEDLYHKKVSLILDFSTAKKRLYIRTSFSAIQNEDLNSNGLIVVLYDVTEHESIERERREFVANVSHELRTPLTTMRSYLEALLDGVWMDRENAPKFLSVTQNETERMIRLVTDLLQLSKMDSSDYRLYKEWVNFTEYYISIIDRFEMIKPTNINFHKNFSDRPQYVYIDVDKLTQVLDNIISNAIKYSPEGGNIYFSLGVEENALHVEVKDEGMGISEGEEAFIFDRFYRVHKARSRDLGGTGLGLAIAKEMIEAHSGQIWAESKETKGTTIHFKIPIEESRDE